MKGARWLHFLAIITILNLFPNLSIAVDTISSSQTLTKNQTLVSSGQVFELGFFSPENTNKWFIGIWYKKIPTKTVVWVANRDSPLSSSSGSLKIDKNNILILTDELGKTIWQSNQSSSSSDTVAQILDTGNFIVRRNNDIDPRNYLWQSFNYPTDTLLPGMKIGLDKKIGLNRFLTSWKNNDDPSRGDFNFRINSNGLPEFILWNNQIELYRSGAWNGLRFSGVPGMGQSNIMNFTFITNKDEDTYSFDMTDSSKYSRLLLNSFGVLQRYVWIQTRQTWNVLWYAPSDQCDTYRECGVFGICNTINSTMCSCIKGFEPKNEQEWNLSDASAGCVRREKLNCLNDGFIKLKNVKLPESTNAAVYSERMSLSDCRKSCRKNCSCNAYSRMDVRAGGSGCVIWVGDLADLRQYSEAGGGQELFIRVPRKLDEGTSRIGRILEHLKTFLEAWDLRIVILVSLLLQILLIFLAPLRKRISSIFLSLPMWLAYLLADITATYALGIISKSQTHEAMGPFADPNLLALWAPFLLVHLGGPDTITAFALEDNELWLRHALSLMFHGWAVSYSFIRAFPNKRLWLPTLLMSIAGLIKYVERTRSLFLASTRRFRSSLLTKPDPGPNYAKLMDEYSSKIEAKLPTKIEMIPEPKRVKNTTPEVKSLSDLEIVQAAHKFFDKFKGLIADLIFSFHERTESRGFFLQRTPRDAFKVVEVELNFIYEILFTKVAVVQDKKGYILRFVSIGLTCASLVLFILFHKHKIEIFDIATTYTLLIGAIALDAIAFIMVLISDWTAVTLTRNKNFLFNFLARVFHVDRDRWPDKKNGPTSKLSAFTNNVAKYTGLKTYRETIRRRWSGSISQYNLLHCCLNPRPEYLEMVISAFGLTNMVDSAQYVKSKEVDDEIRDLVFAELKMKAEVADDLETSKEINSARGDWILRFHEKFELLPWVNDVDYDQSLLLWHIATDLIYSHDEEGEKKEDKSKKGPNYRRFAKRLSDYMLYLLMMESKMMSTVAGIGEIRFRDTCAEAKKFLEGRGIGKGKDGNKGLKEEDSHQVHRSACEKISCGLFPTGIKKDKDGNKEAKEKTPDNLHRSKEEDAKKEVNEEPDKVHKSACKSLLAVHTAVKPVAVKGDRSKSVLFDACMLAKELNKLKGEKWIIMSKVWVELLCYAASRCRASTHAAQLSKGGQFITLVWLLMAHFGLGNQFQISEGHARAKLIVGK